MYSAGNDIVSLKVISVNRTLTPAFYSKILDVSEVNLFEKIGEETITFGNYIWLLWSIKESAYKYLKRLDPNIIFTPVKFIITALKPPIKKLTQDFYPEQQEGKGFGGYAVWEAAISYRSMVLSSRSMVYNNLLYTIVGNSEDLEQVYWGVKRIADPSPASQSAAVRAFLLPRLTGIYPGKTLQISKNKYNIPVIMDGTQELPIPLSLTHHEEYVAYAFCERN